MKGVVVMYNLINLISIIGLVLLIISIISYIKINREQKKKLINLERIINELQSKI